MRTTRPSQGISECVCCVRCSFYTSVPASRHILCNIRISLSLSLSYTLMVLASGLLHVRVISFLGWEENVAQYNVVPLVIFSQFLLIRDGLFPIFLWHSLWCDAQQLLTLLMIQPYIIVRYTLSFLSLPILHHNLVAWCLDDIVAFRFSWDKET